MTLTESPLDKAGGQRMVTEQQRFYCKNMLPLFLNNDHNRNTESVA